jgi:hypothetical protein
VDIAHAASEDAARLSAAEYAALRQTIAIRGTARMIVAPMSCLGWAWLLTAQQPDASSVAALIPLVALAAGFESVHALHVGAERIGRYLQVYYESAPLGGPRWESAAMTVGPALPGGGIDPLFSVVFLGSTCFNLLLTYRTGAAMIVTMFALAVHAGFIVRIVRARVAAARQRAVELESFKALRSREAARD